MVYLFLAYGLLALGMGLIPALITTFRTDFDLSSTQAANVNNFKDGGLILATLAGPILIAKWGTRRTILVALGTALVGSLVFALAGTRLLINTGAALHGGSFSLGIVAAVTQMFTLQPRYQRIAALAATFGLASLLAPVLVAVLVTQSGDFTRIYLLFAVALAALILAGLRAPTEPAARLPTRAWPGWATLRHWIPDITISATLTAGETAVVSWITWLAQFRYGASTVAASVLFATLWVLYTPARAGGDLLRARFGTRRVICVGACLAPVGALLIAGGDLGRAYLGVAVFTLAIAPLVPVQQASALHRVSAEQHGCLNAAFGIGSAALTTTVVWVTGIACGVDDRLPFVIGAGLVLAVVPLALRPLPTPMKGRRKALKE